MGTILKTKWVVKWLSFDNSTRESKHFDTEDQALKRWRQIDGMIRSGNLNATIAWYEPVSVAVQVDDLEFHVYDQTGLYMGKFEAEKAFELVQDNDWTLTEA